jgi:polyhydroxybutyrate depolymerase
MAVRTGVHRGGAPARRIYPGATSERTARAAARGLRRLLIACLGGLSLLPVGGCQAAGPGLEAASLRVDGLTRTFQFYTPRGYDADQAAPLVLVFHGGFGEGLQVARRLGFAPVADREGFLVIYPDALEDHWNDGRESTGDGPDDVAFVRALIDYAAKQRNVDLDRVYATGLSNGGYFTQRLACELDGEIAAFAPVMATMPVPLRRACRPGRPVPMLMISGVDDPLVPYGGGVLRRGKALGGRGGEVIAVPDAAAYWADNNGCARDPEQAMLPDRDPGDGTRVRVTRYEDCEAGAAVRLYAVEGGGHTWPGARERKRIRHIVGATSYDIDASEIIWEFFEAQRLPPAGGTD